MATSGAIQFQLGLVETFLFGLMYEAHLDYIVFSLETEILEILGFLSDARAIGDSFVMQEDNVRSYRARFRNSTYIALRCNCTKDSVSMELGSN
ncbi:hypothetical protein CEXT_282771 [Caerostris extrusa]|uniref:Uncharacterized protein n=1 Tax=Caerostris extrusa TaxID=172846 RepID=A0AAV4P550_CAEEX|nr:hypothetical protein CEXT_282771 [Caerostris extrusa]